MCPLPPLTRHRTSNAPPPDDRRTQRVAAAQAQVETAGRRWVKSSHEAGNIMHQGEEGEGGNKLHAEMANYMPTHAAPP